MKALGIVLLLLCAILIPFQIPLVTFCLDWVGGPKLILSAFWVNLLVWTGVGAFIWQQGSWREAAGGIALFFVSHWWSVGNFLLSRFSLNGGSLDATGQRQLLLTALGPPVCLALLFSFLPLGRWRVCLPVSLLLGLAATGALFALAR